MMKGEDEADDQVKALAVKRNIYPPKASVSEYGQFDFSDDKSADFDEKFSIYAISFLEEELDMLRHAAECEDRWVRLLASDRLPVVENQLAQLRIIAEMPR
jgi:hypothetical protein